MEYQRKKKQVLSAVEYSNLLSFALVDNKLQRNFKSIVQALLLAQTQAAQFKEDLQHLTTSTSKQFTHINSKMTQLENKLNSTQQTQKTSIKNLDPKPESQPLPDTPLESIKALEPVPASLPEPIVSLHSVKEVLNTQTRLTDQYEDLRAKVDKMLAGYVDPEDVDRRLSAMKDSINLIRAQIKVLNQRQSKSSRRLSLGKSQIIPIQPHQQPQTHSDPQQAPQILHLQQQFQKQMNNLHIDVNTLKLCLQEMKEGQSQLKRKQGKMQVQVDDLIRNCKKIQERVQGANQSFQAEIKEIKKELVDLQMKGAQEDHQSSKNKKSTQTKQKQNTISPNFNNQINDRISKLHSMIQGLLSQSQFKRYKSQIKDKLQTLQNNNQNIKKQLKDQIQMVTDILDVKSQQIVGLSHQIQDLKGKINQLGAHCQRKNNIGISRNQEVRKMLQDLREDLEFYKSMNQSSSNSANQVRVIMQGEEERPTKSDQSGGKSVDDLKKYVNRKLHDQRTYLLGLIRDIEKKIGGNGKSNLQQDLVNVWDKIGQLSLFINKKANEQDIKKSLNYYQKKLSNLYNRITSTNENNEDARIAKTNWYCLSCDKSLQNYQGKIGQHMVWDSMPVKPGNSKYFSNKEDKKSLPTLKR